ncbi:MAG: hypothetical protein PHV59_07620 [Victivallales bacterium]|nr:hypothetical protein [Victivallales bacterium]
MKISAYLLIPALVVMAVFPAYALKINGYDPARHDRFISGYPEAPVLNQKFFAAGYDWSGVGWDAGNANRSIALISPLHFVCANHNKIPPGNAVTFLNRDGHLKSYTVAGYSTFSYNDADGGKHVADLALGRLKNPVKPVDNIAYYSVLNADNAEVSGFNGDWYIGKEIISYGETARAGINTIYSFGFITTNKTHSPDNRTFSAISDFHPGLTAQFPDEAGFAGGDSGSLSFLVWNNRLTVIGTHFSAGKDGALQYNADAFLPYYLPDLNSAMKDSGYSVSTVIIDPDPSSLLFFRLE